MRFAVGSLLPAVLWLALALPVAAQQEAEEGETREAQDPSPEDPEAARKARQHFREGMEQFRAHAYREAIRHFHLAGKLVPSADLWFNIARAHEELSEYEPAIEYYRRYLRDRVDPPDRERIERHIELLEKRLEQERAAARRRPTTGTLRVRSEEEGARIEVDDREVGEAPLAVPLTLPAGTHRVEVSKEGHIPLRAEVTMSAGVTTGAYADLQPATEYASARKKRVWTWVVAGLAVGALGAGTGLGIHAMRLNNDGELADARDFGAYSDYAFGAALGLGVVAAIVYFVEGRSGGSEQVASSDP